MYSMILRIKMIVSHFVGAGSFLIGYSDDHIYITCYS
jgi:hypothetical protein